MYADFEVGSHSIKSELEASTSSGRVDAVGMLQAMLQVMLQGARSVDYSLKVLKGILFLGPCPWVLYLLLAGCFVPGSSFLGVLSPGPCSWCCRYCEPWEPWAVSAAVGRYATSNCLASPVACLELWLDWVF